VQKWFAYRRLGAELRELETMSTLDIEMQPICARETISVREKRSALALAIEDLLLPKSPAGGAILEIRAGSGGTEAALFAASLFGMYRQYAVENRWSIDTVEVGCLYHFV